MPNYCPLIKGKCKDDKCEWWDYDSSMCSVRVLAGTTGYIGSRLNEIRMELASRNISCEED